MALPDYISTFGQHTRQTLSTRVHKLAINAAFTCPNRDGQKGYGGCTFCNKASFSPYERQSPPIEQQIEAGRHVIIKRTSANLYITYFQVYTNTYADIDTLRSLYDRALAEQDVVGF